MTPADLAAVAHDVDRLFRARQDGRQMPLGEVAPGRLTEESRIRVLWTPDIAEWRANNLARAGFDHDAGTPRALLFGDKDVFRTRQHVAMLALTEPKFFRRCVATLDGCGDIKPFEIWRTTYEEMLAMPMPLEFDIFGGRMVMKRTRRGGYGHVVEIQVLVPHEKIKADVARTHAYLVDLSERLRQWLEAKAARDAVIKATRDEQDDEDLGAYPAAAWAEAIGDDAMLADAV